MDLLLPVNTVGLCQARGSKVVAVSQHLLVQLPGRVLVCPCVLWVSPVQVQDFHTFEDIAEDWSKFSPLYLKVSTKGRGFGSPFEP